MVRKRYAWFSVDEYQDTNRLQEDLLRLWLGDRRDLCVVGDPDQTIYSFTGASSDHLTTFADRYADTRVVRLSQNYRSTPQVIELANRLIPGRELRAVGADGPRPELVAHADADAELAAIVAAIRGVAGRWRDGDRDRDPGANERAARAARGGAHRRRHPVHRARRPLLRPPGRARRPLGAQADATGRLSRIVATRWRTELGFDEAPPPVRAPRRATGTRRSGTLLAMARSLEAGSARRDRGRLPRRAGATRRRRGRCCRRGRHPVHLASCQGPRVGRRLPADARGGHPADPAVGVRSGRAGRGASAALRRDHARPPAPRPVVGGEPGRREGIRGSGAPFTVHRRAAAERRGSAALARALPFRSRSPSSREADEPLLARLIDWRRERARADGVPAYVVADNKTLAAIAARRPADETQLLGRARHRSAQGRHVRRGDPAARRADPQPRERRSAPRPTTSEAAPPCPGHRGLALPIRVPPS